MTYTQLELPALLDRAQAPVPCTTEPCLFDASEGADAERAKDMCLDCPLMIPCRDWARANGVRGVAGGEDDAERAAAARKPRPKRARQRPTCGTPAGAMWHRRHDPNKKPCVPCLNAETAAARERRLAQQASLHNTPLLPAELRILHALADGSQQRDAAERLGVGRRTVNKYVWIIRQKLDAYDYIAAAQDRGLLTATNFDPRQLEASA